MKRIAIFALIAAFVLAWAGAASAAEIKAKGEFKVNANIFNNKDLRDNHSTNTYDDDFNIYERARVSFDFVASENLMANLYIQVGSQRWGATLFEIGQGDGTPGTIAVRRAYIQFKWPDTNILFTGGYWNVSLPSGWYHGGAILNEEVASLAVQAPIIEDTLSILLGYARAYDGSESSAGRSQDELDGAFVALPVTFSDINLTPFFAAFWRGKDALPNRTNIYRGFFGNAINNSVTESGSVGWWAGLAATVDILDPFKFMFDFDYGTTHSADKVSNRAGWFMDFAVQYNGLDFMTPELLFAYGSGEDKKLDNGSERMPSIDPDWGIDGSTWFNGSSLLSGDLGNGGDGRAAGYWALGILVKDITFLENLYHTLNLIYAAGTNDRKLVTENMTAGAWNDGSGTLSAMPTITYGTTLFSKDYLFEVDFNHKYQIYEELAAIVELSYDYLHTDKDTWNAINPGINGTAHNLWKAAFGLIYSF